MGTQLAYILVGDHLGQVKRVLLPSGEVSTVPDCAKPSSSNPVVSIEQIQKSKHLIANKNGELYVYDSVYGKTKQCETTGSDSLVKAIPLGENNDVVLVYEKQVIFNGRGGDDLIKQKKGQIKNAKTHDNKLALVGKDIPLRIFDINTKSKIFEAGPPDKNWLGIQPECMVAGLDFVGQTRVATCSKSDSVIRVYDTRQQACKSLEKPIIKIDVNQTAFNEHADSGRFTSVASTGIEGHSIVVGSNVGQLLAIDLRFNVKQLPKKKLQPKTFKILGGFKGARGATVKDIKVVPSASVSCGQESEAAESFGYKVISCCLDRYLRIHNFSRTSRQLDKHVYMKTKPYCCSPVFYEDP